MMAAGRPGAAGASARKDMQQVQQRSDGPNLQRVLSVLWRRAPWVVICAVLAAGAAFALSKHQVKKYTATTSLAFNSNQLTQQIAGIPTSISPQAQQNSNVKLVAVGDMAEKTAAQLGQGLTARKVGESLSIAQEGETTAIGESSIVGVSVSVTSPTLAARIANAYAAQFVTEQRATNHHYFTSALALVQKQLAALPPSQRFSAAGVALLSRAQSLKLLADLQYGGVQIAQRASVPTAPTSPRTKRNTLIGGALGLIVGLGIALLLEYLDRRIREPEELEEIFEAPLLGVVPESRALARFGKGRVGVLPPTEAEAFSLLLAHLRSYNAESDHRIVLMTSASAGQGNSTVALHLAEAAACIRLRTLLVELDLRRPKLARHLGIEGAVGTSDVLVGAVRADEAIHSVTVTGRSDGGAGEQILDVMVAGEAPLSTPGEMLESYAMSAVLTRASSIYDLIVIDTPPLTAVSDAFPILRQADGVIVVASLGLSRDAAEPLRQVLDRSGASLLGVVANRVQARRFRLDAYKRSESHKASPGKSSDSVAVAATQER
jgi:Mrp family chromosome partitioning ATPase